MALSKTIAYAGVTGDYIRIGYHHWDRGAREASAHLHLYASASAAASLPATPLRPIMAKLRLAGDKFDEYLSTSVLAASDNDIIGQLYAAAKVEPVISDWGSDIFADALDV